MKYKKIIIITLLIVLPIIGFFIGVKYSNNKTINEQKYYYIGQIYQHVDVIDGYLERMEDEELVKEYIQDTVEELEKLRTTLLDANRILSASQEHHFLSTTGWNISFISGKLEEIAHSNSINEEEFTYINKLKSDFETIEYSLTANPKNVGQINNFSFKELETMFKALDTEYYRKTVFSEATGEYNLKQILFIMF